MPTRLPETSELEPASKRPRLAESKSMDPEPMDVETQDLKPDMMALLKDIDNGGYAKKS